MGWLFSTALEIFAAAVILIPVYLILNKAYFLNIKKTILYCIFSFYLVAVYALVGMPNVSYVRFDLTLNLIPIVGMINDLRSNILNVLLFVPLGIMLPILWEKYRGIKDTVRFGFGMSLAIELLQILTFRATDINDLITNTAGTLLGYSVASILMKKCPSVKGCVSEEKSGELYLVCGVVFLVMFFVQPFIFSILWDLIMH